jgi:uncharacterized membrane protein YebE (DUF533 family)
MKRLTVSAQTCVEILGLLVAMAWADGKLDDAEKDGVRAAAGVLNLPKTVRDELDKLLEKPTPFEELLLEKLSAKDRAFAFVAAAWMAGTDANVAEKERGLLDRLADRLGFSHERRDELIVTAKDIGPRAKDGKLSDELVKLFRSIPPRLYTEESADALEVVFE